MTGQNSANLCITTHSYHTTDDVIATEKWVTESRTENNQCCC